MEPNRLHGRQRFLFRIDFSVCLSNDFKMNEFRIKPISTHFITLCERQKTNFFDWQVLFIWVGIQTKLRVVYATRCNLYHREWNKDEMLLRTCVVKSWKYKLEMEMMLMCALEPEYAHEIIISCSSSSGSFKRGRWSSNRCKLWCRFVSILST